jgi:hypothetical protein
MKIAFDIHGTISKDPDVFKPMMEALVNSGVEVFIISGPPEEQIRSELTKLGYFESIHYQRCNVLSVVDYLRFNSSIPMTQDEKGHWWCDDFYWWESKGILCDNFKINMIIDNEMRYKSNMPDITTFILWS